MSVYTRRVDVLDQNGEEKWLGLLYILKLEPVDVGQWEWKGRWE